ncbi:hypothetical protein CYMTET_19828 [Cymbomonas tetramitiformis]|uniref:Protein SDA1 n=1 Tax=Cymbomonas tetramitiformis TaxID=36881 RepID=A0AAE0L4H7_9CHLO|nr:hypothetical protein CYMTET_19828 [Cymbomonas tetramitiformis]
MAGTVADLKLLQGKIKRDPEGYRDEFLLQIRHYRTLLEIFRLKPTKDSKEFSDLIDFLSHVATCFPEDTSSYAQELIELLDKHYSLLDSTLRRKVVEALILLRNRGRLSSVELLPVFFRLFRCNDKRLRQMLFKHIVSDLHNSNKKHRNEKLNRTLQNFLFEQLTKEEHVTAAKKSLAVLTEMYRRNVWTDARPVNVIATACFHPDTSILIAALKFFLGQDDAAGEEDSDDDDDDDDDEGGPHNMNVNPLTKDDMYKAYRKVAFFRSPRPELFA